MKKKKEQPAQEQNKFQKYKEDSISILKQLQESGPAAESIFNKTDKNNKSFGRANEPEKKVLQSIPQKPIVDLKEKNISSGSDNPKKKSELQLQKEAFKKQMQEELN